MHFGNNKLLPTASQAESLVKAIGCARYVYNKALCEKQTAYKANKTNITYKQLSKQLTNWRATLPWLSEAPSVPLQQSLRHLDKAYSNFYRRVKAKQKPGFPKFKKKGHGGSLHYMQNSFSLQEGQLKIQKIKEPIKITWPRGLPSVPSSCVVKLLQDNTWRASFVCEVSYTKLAELDKYIGLDVGLTTYITLSTGHKIYKPKFLQMAHRAIRQTQKKLARQKKGGQNRLKTKRKLVKLHALVANRRRDFINKVSYRLVRENQAIFAEKLMIKNMLKNRRLSKAISEASWGEIFRQLEYKCRLYGRTFLQIGRFEPTSKKCSSCGHVLPELKLSIRSWECPVCKTKHDRDINAAKNVEAVGFVAYKPVELGLDIGNNALGCEAGIK